MIITPLLIVFMCVVFVLVYLFVRTIDKRKWLNILVSLVLTPIVYFYMLYPFLNIISSFHHEKYFNAEQWSEEPGLRYEMINQMITDSVFIGKSKAETEALLGTYEWLGWDDSLKQHDNNKWNYGLGLIPGAFNETKECVTFVFKDNRVIDLERFTEDIVYEDQE